jgi:hypothetical protein
MLLFCPCMINIYGTERVSRSFAVISLHPEHAMYRLSVGMLQGMRNAGGTSVHYVTAFETAADNAPQFTNPNHTGGRKTDKTLREGFDRAIGARLARARHGHLAKAESLIGTLCNICNLFPTCVQAGEGPCPFTLGIVGCYIAI